MVTIRAWKYWTISITNGSHHVPTTKLTLFTVIKDEWYTKKSTGKSIKNALYGKKHLSGWRDVEQQKNQASSVTYNDMPFWLKQHQTNSYICKYLCLSVSISQFLSKNSTKLLKISIMSCWRLIQKLFSFNITPYHCPRLHFWVMLFPGSCLLLVVSTMIRIFESIINEHLDKQIPVLMVRTLVENLYSLLVSYSELRT